MEEVLISALEDKIYKANVVVSDSSQEVLSMLKTVLAGGAGMIKSEPAPIQNTEIKEVVSPDNVIEFSKPKELVFDNVERIQEISESDIEDFDDMDDLMYLMK